MIKIEKQSDDFWFEDLPEDGETGTKAMKDQLFAVLIETVTAALRHLIYHSDTKSHQTVSLEEMKNANSFLTLYVSHIADEKNIVSKFVVKLLTTE